MDIGMWSRPIILFKNNNKKYLTYDRLKENEVGVKQIKGLSCMYVLDSR